MMRESVGPISALRTKSAIWSSSVGSRFKITSVAPFSLAMIGSPAAGRTTSDEPRARKRSHSSAACTRSGSQHGDARSSREQKRSSAVVGRRGPGRPASLAGEVEIVDPSSGQLVARSAQAWCPCRESRTSCGNAPRGSRHPSVTHPLIGGDAPHTVSHRRGEVAEATSTRTGRHGFPHARR